MMSRPKNEVASFPSNPDYWIGQVMIHFVLALRYSADQLLHQLDEEDHQTRRGGGEERQEQVQEDGGY